MIKSSKNNDSFDLHSISTYQAGTVQASIHRLLQKLSDDILKPYGITKMQWMLIGAVYDAGSKGVRITDLAKQLDTSLPYLTNSINLLTAQNKLVRNVDENDARAKFVCIHPSFKKSCIQIEQTLRLGLRETIYSHVSEEEFATYMRVLYKLRNIGKKPVVKS